MKIRGNFRSRRHAVAVYRKAKEDYWTKKVAEKKQRLGRMSELLMTGTPVDLIGELSVSRDTVLGYIKNFTIAPGLYLAELSDGCFQLKEEVKRYDSPNTIPA
jgi:hypothetical protein